LLTNPHQISRAAYSDECFTARSKTTDLHFTCSVCARYLVNSYAKLQCSPQFFSLATLQGVHVCVG